MTLLILLVKYLECTRSLKCREEKKIKQNSAALNSTFSGIVHPVKSQSSLHDF